MMMNNNTTIRSDEEERERERDCAIAIFLSYIFYPSLFSFFALLRALFPSTFSPAVKVTLMDSVKQRY
jgi:hypothetical protein